MESPQKQLKTLNLETASGPWAGEPGQVFREVLSIFGKMQDDPDSSEKLKRDILLIVEAHANYAQAEAIMKQLEMLEKLKENGHSVMLGADGGLRLVWCNNGTPIGLRTAKDNAKSEKA